MTDPILLNLPLPIVTPRLMLRPAQAGDGAAVHEAKQESWPELKRFDIWTWGEQADATIENDELFCRRKYIKFLGREDLTFLTFDRQTGRLIGCAGLHNCDWQNGSFMVGFWVRTGQTRKGYAAEAGNALCRYAFEALNAHKITSFHAEGNTGSASTLLKLGFTPEGVLRKQHDQSDRPIIEEHHYGLLDPARLPKLEVSWGV